MREATGEDQPEPSTKLGLPPLPYIHRPLTGKASVQSRPPFHQTAILPVLPLHAPITKMAPTKSSFRHPLSAREKVTL